VCVCVDMVLACISVNTTWLSSHGVVLCVAMRCVCVGMVLACTVCTRARDATVACAGIASGWPLDGCARFFCREYTPSWVVGCGCVGVGERVCVSLLLRVQSSDD
jgi:hypothetical protein